MHISREVYEAMYALSLYDLVALQDKDKAWQAVQDRLVGGVGVDFIRPAREVVGQIEKEASALWRSTRRGNSESKRLNERLSGLGRNVREAKDRDQKLRALSDEVAQYVQRSGDLNEERRNLRIEKRKIDRLAPIRERLRQIDNARQEAGDPAELAGLPDDPAMDLGTIAGKIGEAEKQQKQLESEREDAGRILAAVEAGKGFDMEVGPQSRYIGLLSDQRRTEDNMEQAWRRLDEQARQLLTEAWNDCFTDIISGISQATLRARISAFETARDKFGTAQREEALRSRNNAPRGLGIASVFLLVATVLVAALVAPFLVVLGPIGLIGLFIGVLSLLVIGGYIVYQSRKGRSPRTVSARSLKDFESDLVQRRADVCELLDGLPVPEERLKNPDMTLVSDLKSIQDAVRGWQDAQCRKGSIMADLQKVARKEQKRIEQECDALTQVLNPLEEEQQALETALRVLGDGDIEQGIARAAVRKKAYRLAQTLEEKMGADFADEDMTEVRREIETLEREGVAWAVSDDSVIRLDDRLEEVDEEIHALTERRTAAQKDIENLLKQPTLAALESEREQLRSELKAIEERHDRLCLLQHIVREADRRFREAHQPDVLRRASGYVQTITGRRYERFDYDEDEKLRVYEAGNTRRPWPVGAPLSQGTLDQMYLAIRFALVDHLDESKESLPVFLDEVFVNWDRDRRARCYDIFSEAVARRQVFVFTCHPWLAEEMEETLSAKRIPL